MKKPIFKPKPGQIDYTNARWAPVINCVVKFEDTILLVQRSKDLNFYPGYWSGISGFLDDKKTLVQKTRDELREEAGVKNKDIKNIRLGEIFHQDEPKYKKTWIVHPVLAEVRTNTIKLNWESRNYQWVSAKGAEKLKLMPGFDQVLEKLSTWLEK